MAGGFRGLHEKLVDRFGTRAGGAVYTFVACLLALSLSGLVAHLVEQPLIFPSLGPTAFLFFEQPMARTASPRNTLIGHVVAVGVGAFSLWLFSVLDNPSILQEGVSYARVGAAALSVALTGALLLLLRASHPPSGATVLIVSLGLLQTFEEMIALVLGVLILTVVGWSINRLSGVPVPLWAPKG
jgi:CBS domain-containing membrane protein